MSVTEIPTEGYGIFTITTETGTEFELVLADEHSTLTRRPGMSAPTTGDTDPRMEGDFDALPLSARSDVAVGHAASFTVVVNEDFSLVTTTAVVRIEEKS